MPRLYEPGVFVETLLSDLRPSAVRKAVRSELRAGAHSSFLEQATRLAASNLEFLAARDIEAIVRNTFAEAPPTAPIPEPSETGLTRALSRAYRDGEPLRLERGALHGIFTETYADMAEWAKRDRTAAQAAWNEGANSFFERALPLPGMDFELFDTLSCVTNAIDQTLGSGFHPSDNGVMICRFIRDRLTRRATFKDFVREFLGSWSDSAPLRFWKLVHDVMEVLAEPFERPTTRFLLTLFELSPRDGAAYGAADKVCQGPGFQSKGLILADYQMMMSGFTFLIEGLRGEMPHEKTRRAIIRWLLRVQPSTRAGILFQLAFRMEVGAERVALDERAEAFIEEVFGPEAWPAICVYQDLKYWGQKRNTGGAYSYIGKADTSLPEFKIIEHAVRNPRLTRHDPNVAEAFEDLLGESDVTADAAARTLEESLDILSGDLVVVVSHLRDEWMSVRRRSAELLGSVLPRVDIAKHHRFGDKNAACKFRIPSPDDARKVLKGTLNPEGELLLENAPLLEASAQLLVRAVVAHTVCAVLVPSLVEEFVPPPTSSGPTVKSGRPWASRPIIRTEGEIGGTANGDDTEVRGSRLNPNIATALFRWLLGHGGGLAFRLLVETEEKIGGKPEKYFVFRAGARELLRRRQLPMSAAYIRAVRAHTQPTGAYLDEDEIRIKQMSAKAERHYGRYRREGGRELDFSPIQKTYLLPEGVRVPLDVPRTFNQGHFISLEEAAELIFDLSLREAIRQTFAR